MKHRKIINSLKYDLRTNDHTQREYLPADLSDRKIWLAFVDFAFDISDYFSLKNYDDDKSSLTENLSVYRVTDIPDDLTRSVFGEYEIKYYFCDNRAKVLIKDIHDITKMRAPEYPEDICFYKDGKEWFCSITHDYKEYYADYFIYDLDPDEILSVLPE